MTGTYQRGTQQLMMVGDLAVAMVFFHALDAMDLRGREILGAVEGEQIIAVQKAANLPGPAADQSGEDISKTGLNSSGAPDRGFSQASITGYVPCGRSSASSSSCCLRWSKASREGLKANTANPLIAASGSYIGSSGSGSRCLERIHGCSGTRRRRKDVYERRRLGHDETLFFDKLATPQPNSSPIPSSFSMTNCKTRRKNAGPDRQVVSCKVAKTQRQKEKTEKRRAEKCCRGCNVGRERTHRMQKRAMGQASRSFALYAPFRG